jgi:hypothetical protein
MCTVAEKVTDIAIAIASLDNTSTSGEPGKNNASVAEERRLFIGKGKRGRRCFDLWVRSVAPHFALVGHQCEYT